MADNKKDITFVVHKDWLDSIQGLPIEVQDQVISDLIRFGTEMEMVHTDDPVVSSMVNLVKGRIEYSKDKYQAKVEAGKGQGRKKLVNDYDVWQAARTGKTAQEIADSMGVKKSTIDHNIGWLHRKNDDEFVF